MPGMQYDPDAALAHLSDADPLLAPLIAACPFTLESDPERDVFGYLLRSIIYQQLHGKAAATILGRVIDLFPGTGYPTPQQLLQVDAATLRTAGVSGAKVLALHDLARHALDGAVPSVAEAADIDDAELVKRLTAVRGIGPWTVEMLLIFRLGRPDVLPVSDYGVRKGFQITYALDDMPPPAVMRELSEAWRPFRSVGSWYMWRALEQ